MKSANEAETAVVDGCLVRQIPPHPIEFYAWCETCHERWPCAKRRCLLSGTGLRSAR